MIAASQITAHLVGIWVLWIIIATVFFFVLCAVTDGTLTARQNRRRDRRAIEGERRGQVTTAERLKREGEAAQRCIDYLYEQARVRVDQGMDLQ